MAAQKVRVLGRIYNAFGDTVSLGATHDWEGKVIFKYPEYVHEGEWGVFEHGNHWPTGQGSVGAVVYKLENCCDVMIAWNNPLRMLPAKNTAYCEMKEPGYFDNCNWDAIRAKLKESGTKSKASFECYSTEVGIEEGGLTPMFIAFFHIDDD